MEVREGYKNTEVGIIPEDWEAKQLKSVCLMKSGNSITSENISDFEKYPCYGGNGLRGYTNSYTHSGKYGLIGRQGALCGNVNFVDDVFFASEHAVVVTPGNNTDIKWLTYILFRMNLNQYSESSAQPGLSVYKISILPIPVPPTKSEQTAIATALSDADALINSLEKLIAKKRNIKQGAMQKLLQPKEGWEVKKLGEIAEVRDGTHQTPTYVESGVPFYSVESVTNNNFNNTKYITEEAHKLLTKTFRIEKGDILMTRIGSIGDCKLINWDVNASFYVSIALLKIKSDNSAEYIFHYSKTAFFKKEADINSLQSAIPKKINLGPISNIKIEMPDYNEQIRIATILSDMDTEIQALETKLEKYRKIKLGMMQNLLTGKIRLV